MNAAEHLLGAGALERHGPRPALICADETVTYLQLAQRMQRAAGALRERGVRPGDRVLLLMRDGPEFAAAWLGILYAGAVAVALNTQLSEEDYRHIAADCEARLAIVDEGLVALRPDLAAELRREGRLAIAAGPPGDSSWEAALERARPGAPAFLATREHPAFWLYSSGTTGRPKGIVHTHRSVLPAGEAFRMLGIAPGERVFTTSKFFFAYGLEHGLLGCLALGITSLVCADWPEPERALEIVARHRPSAVFSVPSFYRRLLGSGRCLKPLRNVRHFVGAGERMPGQLITQWRAAVGSELLSLYGMSETFCACMLTPPGAASGARTGLPLGGTEVRLVADDGSEVREDEPGVLWVRHPALASGYANRPAAMREQFVDGWFCSRDLFVRDAEGFYSHLGRSDEFIKVAGQWVQPAEVEEVVSALPVIEEAACVAVHDTDGFERLALFVAARGSAEGAQSAAERECEARLPRHKRPKWIHAVEQIPRTATGKVQRYKLREMLERQLARKG
jgi:3-hydroxybenzoate/4-hydroxybenzoate---CoA ligase